ncbi:uncharacterized protein [Musca autumnalis]|uniref:uncharacterized protein n=1 Tax=Musca autumnalis TaxID=221902 RepID=UPI003CE82769
MAQLSEAQFQKLIQAMNNNKRIGSFAHCTARFRGQREPAAVEEFLTAITVFKDIENISDADAVTGLQLLLEGYAANWWIGVKKNVNTFDQAKALIKKTFSPPVPDWRLFTQIYEHKQQRTEHTDTFICKKRLLFSQLKSAVDEEIQLNLIFGLLRQNIRERVKRESITSFEELLSACREAELSLAEYDETTTTTTPLAETKAEAKTIRCAMCRTFKHETAKCWKKKMRDEQHQVQRNDVQQQPHTKQQQDNAQRSTDTQQQPSLRKATIACYGCGAPGVFRSNCSNCSNNNAGSPQNLSFNSFSPTIIGRTLPTTHIEIFGLLGEAVFDTGAKVSVASLNLKNILEENGCVFENVCADVCLADGSVTTCVVKSTMCNVNIGGREKKIRFVCLPNATRNRTLLGTDFLEKAGIVLDMPQRLWYFADEPRRKNNFTNPLEMSLFSLDVIGYENSPTNKAMTGMSKFIEFVETKNLVSPLPATPVVPPNDYSPHTIQQVFHGALRSGESTPQLVSDLFPPPHKMNCDDPTKPIRRPLADKTNDYSPHSIQSIFRGAIPPNETTPGNTTRLFGPPVKISKKEQDDYLDSVFMPLFSVDISTL